MGFFDTRCLATGVSLKGSDAALVLLQPDADGYSPIALAMKGTYDRLGSIDMIDEDENTQMILKYFLRELDSGSFVVDEDYLRSSDRYPIETTESLLSVFERNMNDGPGYATLHGKPVVFALFSQIVWDAIAAETSPADSTRNAFGGSEIVSAIYVDAIKSSAKNFGEFAAVDAFLKRRGIRWQPSEGTGQDYPEEMQQYLAEAKQTFADAPVIVNALRAYERDVADLLVDDSESDSD